MEASQAEIFHESEQFPPPDLVARHLGVKVADNLPGAADVSLYDREQILVRTTPTEKLEDREPQALLEDILGFGRHRPPAYVDGVTGIGEEGDRFPVTKDGGHHSQVVEVSGGLPRIVGDEDIPGIHSLPRDLHKELPNALRRRVDMPRRPAHGLGQHPTLDIEDGCREILSLAHHRREGGTNEGGSLLVHDGDQPVPQHLKQDGVDGCLCCHGLTSTTRLPMSSTLTTAPGPTMVVHSSSSTMAGPATSTPSGRR